MQDLGHLLDQVTALCTLIAHFYIVLHANVGFGSLVGPSAALCMLIAHFCIVLHTNA